MTERPNEKHKKEYIEIGMAIIREGNKFLVAKRPKGKLSAGKWEFPGGKIEFSESPEECIIREIEEEFGMSVAAGKLFKVWDYEYPEFGKFRFYSYLYDTRRGTPKLLWHEEMAWMDVASLKKIDLLEADKELIPLLDNLKNENNKS